MTVTTKGKPVKKTVLYPSQQTYYDRLIRNTYASVAAMTRCETSLVGNSGSIFHCRSLGVRIVSQIPKPVKQSAEPTSIMIIATLLHANWTPPSSNETIRRHDP